MSRKSQHHATPTPPDENLSTAFDFFNEIGIISQLSGNRMQRTLPHGLTRSQFSVLNWFVRVDRQATPGRLAKAFEVTAGAMTNTLTRLRDKGFIRMEPDPHSGRSKIVRLTRSGRAALEDARAATEEDLARFLEAFPPDRLKAALPFLRSVRVWLDEARYRP